MWILRMLWWHFIGRRRWRPRRTYTMGGGWGDTISWVGGVPGRVVGWKVARPAVGDCLLVPMQSGRTARYRFVKVELKRDPPDMFFADVDPIDYVAP